MPPLIRRPRGLSGFQLGLGVAIGVVGGIYIWKPNYDKYFKDRAIQIKEEAEIKKNS